MSKKNKEDKDEIIFKIIVLGDSNSGKTSIIKKFLNSKYDIKTISTIGFGSFNKEITLKDGTIIKLNIIDTASQENYQALSATYLKNSDGVLFVFSHNNRQSLENVKHFLVNFKESEPNLDLNQKIPSYLIGNNYDLEHVIDDDEIEELKTSYNFFGYTNINSKDNTGIDDLFQDMGEILYKTYGKRKKKGIVKLSGKHKKNKNCYLI